MRGSEQRTGKCGQASLPTSTCPTCRYEMTEAALVGGPLRAMPKSGDLSVCLNCGEHLQYNDILVLKPLPPTLWAQLDGYTQNMLTRATQLIRERGRIR